MGARGFLTDLRLWFAALVVMGTATMLMAQEPLWKQYGYYAPPTLKVVTVKVVFQTFEQTRAVCGGGAGCLKGRMDEKGRWVGVPEIYAPTPEGFNDTFAMTILGHELMHALGAYHD